MATKKAVKKVAPPKAVKKQYAWYFDDGDCTIGTGRFDSIAAVLKDVEGCDPDGSDDIVVVEIVKKYRAKSSVTLQEIK